MSSTSSPVDNGVNTEALLGAKRAFTENPAAARFQWRARCEWVKGTHSRSTVEDFFGLGQEQKHRTKFSFDIDHPELFAATDQGATPVEVVLTALAGCLTATVASIAQHRQIQLRSVTATLEGGCDLRGILGIDAPGVRNGFDSIKVVYDIKADATREQIEALVAQAQKRSAVFDVVSNPTKVTVEVR